MLEAGVLVGPNGEVLYQHAPSGRSGAYLPDSRELWDVIWEHRHRVLGFAHSHPGSGYPYPSDEDLTTFAAVEQGIGRRLLWWITSKTEVVVCVWAGPDRHHYSVWYPAFRNLTWLDELRRISNYEGT